MIPTDAGATKLEFEVNGAHYVAQTNIDATSDVKDVISFNKQ